MRKFLLAMFITLIAVPSIATLALADTSPGGHDQHGTESGGGGGNPDSHDGHETTNPDGGGNPDNHDLIRKES